MAASFSFIGFEMVSGLGTGVEDGTVKKFDQIIREGVLQGAVPGVSATVVSSSGVLWEGAAGERALGSGVPMTVDTVGAIHSMTKAVTGAAAMQLVEQGRVDLDGPAGDVIPWLGEVEVLEGFEACLLYTSPSPRDA